MKKLISFIIPIFNEEENIGICYAEMDAFSKRYTQYDFEFLFANNCSIDRSLEIVRELRQKDTRVKYLSYSKNFGHQQSILQGILHAKGDAVVIIDCDLQDPLEVIDDFFHHWENGYQVVYGVRIARVESKFTTFLRKSFYYTIDKISEEALPLDAGDFRLLDRKIVEQLRHVSEQKPYLRAIVASLGFKQIGVPYVRKGRVYGVSKFPFKENLRLAFHGILNHSNLPLRLATYLGIVMTLFAFIGFCFFMFLYFVKGSNWPKGYTSLILVIIFSIGLNSLFLGIVGEYINRIYSLLRKRDHRAVIAEHDGIMENDRVSYD